MVVEPRGPVLGSITFSNFYGPGVTINTFEVSFSLANAQCEHTPDQTISMIGHSSGTSHQHLLFPKPIENNLCLSPINGTFIIDLMKLLTVKIN